MKTRSLITVVVCCGLALPALAQQGSSSGKPAKDAAKDAAKGAAKDMKAQPAAPDMDAMMKAWEAAATPGEMHQWMAHRAGEWDMVVEAMNWMDPTAPSTKDSGTTTSEMIYGGRYIVSKVKSTMMGMPFEGMEIMGYNNTSKKFESVWFDSMGTAMMMQTGTYDEKTKTLTMTGEGDDPMTGGKMKMRSVVTIKDNDGHTFDMYGSSAGQPEMKMMTITYTRKGAKKSEKADSKAEKVADKAQKEAEKAAEGARSTYGKAKEAAKEVAKPKP